MQNFARPLRISLAIALAPACDRLIDGIAARTGLATRWAFGLLLVVIACVTSSALACVTMKT